MKRQTEQVLQEWNRQQETALLQIQMLAEEIQLQDKVPHNSQEAMMVVDQEVIQAQEAEVPEVKQNKSF